MNGHCYQPLEVTLEELKATRIQVTTMSRPVILQRTMFERVLTVLRQHPNDPECRALLAEFRWA